jgi:histidine triad (HIT) family protein
MSVDCLFCKIGEKKIPAKLIYEDAELFAFDDISPQAPTHILICARKHFAALHDAETGDRELLGKMLLAAGKLARERNLLEGYRTVFNNGAGAGQTVFHLHLHVLGGRAFHWPPG